MGRHRTTRNGNVKRNEVHLELQSMHTLYSKGTENYKKLRIGLTTNKDLKARTTEIEVLSDTIAQVVIKMYKR